MSRNAEITYGDRQAAVPADNFGGSKVEIRRITAQA
jgi:hypothetical protein